MVRISMWNIIIFGLFLFLTVFLIWGATLFIAVFYKVLTARWSDYEAAHYLTGNIRILLTGKVGIYENFCDEQTNKNKIR
jgi:hypothetical protein